MEQLERIFREENIDMVDRWVKRFAPIFLALALIYFAFCIWW